MRANERKREREKEVGSWNTITTTETVLEVYQEEADCSRFCLREQEVRGGLSSLSFERIFISYLADLVVA
jgi:hypothetical protein